MKLRIAKKVCWNDYYGKCHYAAITLNKAIKKFQPYNIRSCNKKNKELETQGSSIRFLPYLFRETTNTLITNDSLPDKSILIERYRLIQIKNFPELNNIKL